MEPEVADLEVGRGSGEPPHVSGEMRMDVTVLARLSPALRGQHSEIPWPEVIAF